MKHADFKNLLQGVREAGGYLRQIKKVEALAGSLGSGRTPVSIKRMKEGAKFAMARGRPKGSGGKKGRAEGVAEIDVSIDHRAGP